MMKSFSPCNEPEYVVGDVCNLLHMTQRQSCDLLRRRLLCELRMADVLFRAICRQAVCLRAPLWLVTATTHQLEHFVTFSTAPVHRHDAFFHGFSNSSNCTHFVLLSHSSSAFCTFATPLRTLRTIALQHCPLLARVPVAVAILAFAAIAFPFFSNACPCPSCPCRCRQLRSLASALDLGRGRGALPSQAQEHGPRLSPLVQHR